MSGMYIPPAGTMQRVSVSLAEASGRERDEVDAAGERALVFAELERKQLEQAAEESVLKAKLDVVITAVGSVQSCVAAGQKFDQQSNDGLNAGERFKKELLTPPPDTQEARVARLRDYAENRAKETPGEVLNESVASHKKAAKSAGEAKSRHAGLRDEMAEQSRASASTA